MDERSWKGWGMNKWVDGGWMDEWVDGRRDGGMDGQTKNEGREGYVYVCEHVCADEGPDR